MERDTGRDIPNESSSAGPGLPAGREKSREDASNDSLRGRVGGSLPERDHELLLVRGYYVRVTGSQLATLRDVGRFRTVEAADLATFRYQGRNEFLQQDLREMEAQGLTRRITVQGGPNTKSLPVVVLTKTGKATLVAYESRVRPQGTQDAQQHYAGFVKPKEVRHDAAIYRMFQAEAQRLARDGATVRRVVLDYELKARVYAPLAKARSLPKPEFAKLQLEVARANGLKVIGGKIPLPDLRIEYETSAGQAQSVDLELATGHYHGGAMATKAQAGFRFYVSDGSAARLSRSLEERDITVAILSL